MTTITKISDITVADVAEYLRLPDGYGQTEASLLSNLLTVAKAYCSHYTGKTETELDAYPDVVIAVLILCQDMYDNRVLYVGDDIEVNHTVQTILGLHEVNLLCSE